MNWKFLGFLLLLVKSMSVVCTVIFFFVGGVRVGKLRLLDVIETILCFLFPNDKKKTILCFFFWSELYYASWTIFFTKVDRFVFIGPFNCLLYSFANFSFKLHVNLNVSDNNINFLHFKKIYIIN